MKTLIFFILIPLLYTETFSQSQVTVDLINIKNSLDSIYAKDQNLRNQLDSLEENSLVKPAEIEALWRKIKNQDSINLIQVTNIIDQYGWLGPDKIGTLANSTIFLVIQHSNLKTMEKYLPVMKEAVDRGNAQKSAYAMLVDRIEMLNHRPQICVP